MTVDFTFVQPAAPSLQIVQEEVGFLGFTGSGLPGRDGKDAPALTPVPFSHAGPLAVKTGTQRFYVDYDVLLTKFRVALGTAADAQVSVGFSIDGVPFTELHVPAGQTQALLEAIDFGVNAGSYLTIDVLAVGSPAAPGADLTVTLWMQLTT